MLVDACLDFKLVEGRIVIWVWPFDGGLFTSLNNPACSMCKIRANRGYSFSHVDVKKARRGRTKLRSESLRLGRFITAGPSAPAVNRGTLHEAAKEAALITIITLRTGDCRNGCMCVNDDLPTIDYVPASVYGLSDFICHSLLISSLVSPSVPSLNHQPIIKRSSEVVCDSLVMNCMMRCLFSAVQPPEGRRVAQRLSHQPDNMTLCHRRFSCPCDQSSTSS
jgi:hypothetical protein